LTRQYVTTADRQKQIIDTARDIICSEGGDTLTIKNIASKLGIAPSAVYKHCSNKNEIVMKLLESIESEVMENINRILSEERLPIRKLDKLMEIHPAYIYHKLGQGERFITMEIISSFPEMKHNVFSNINIIKQYVKIVFSEFSESDFKTSGISVSVYSDLYLSIFQSPFFWSYLSGAREDVLENIEQNWASYKKLIFKESVYEC